MFDLVKCVSMLLAITIATGEITNSKGKQNQKDLNHISDQSDLLLAPRSNFGTFQLPNFVGFSYSRASIGGPKTRFINFRERNLNINADFDPRFSSFKVTKTGVYSFNFGFLSERSDAAIVALRKNEKTIVSGISDVGGHNPVFQSTLLPLQVGDVVQLQVMEGSIYETSHQDYAYTTFSGWLVASDYQENSFPNRNAYDNENCCCSRVCPVRPNEPPFLRPSYLPSAPKAPTKGYGAPKPQPPDSGYRAPKGYGAPKPQPPDSGYGAPKGRPIYNPIPKRRPNGPDFNPRPSYNPKPSYKPTPTYRPDLVPPPPPVIAPPSPPVGTSVIETRDPKNIPRGAECCDSLLVSASSRGRAIVLQGEKFGVYRREYLNLNQDGRHAYKHCNRENYLFYYDNPGWSGWVVGPEVNVGRGGLMIESDSFCPEATASGGWSCYNETGFVPDSTVTISCFDDGYLDGQRSDSDDSFGRGRLPYPRGSNDLDSTLGSQHFHSHQHYHSYDSSGVAKARSLSISRPDQLPAYQVKSNSDLVEATFVFPNKRADSFVNVAKLGLDNLNFTPPVLTPDLFVNSLPKRSITNIDNHRNASTERQKSNDGFIVKFVPVNTTQLVEDEVNNDGNT